MRAMNQVDQVDQEDQADQADQGVEFDPVLDLLAVEVKLSLAPAAASA